MALAAQRSSRGCEQHGIILYAYTDGDTSDVYFILIQHV